MKNAQNMEAPAQIEHPAGRASERRAAAGRGSRSTSLRRMHHAARVLRLLHGTPAAAGAPTGAWSDKHGSLRLLAHPKRFKAAEPRAATGEIDAQSTKRTCCAAHGC